MNAPEKYERGQIWQSRNSLHVMLVKQIEDGLDETWLGWIIGENLRALCCSRWLVNCRFVGMATPAQIENAERKLLA